MKRSRLIPCFLLLLFTILAFSVTQRVSASSEDNLLINGNAEGDTSGWTDPNGTGKWISIPYEEWRGEYVYPYEGGGFFYSSAQTGSESLYQDVDISGYQTGTTFTLSAWLANWNQAPNDQSILKLEFFGSTGTSKGSYIRQQRNPIWAYHSITADKPEGAVIARVTLIANRFVGTDNDAYFDDIRLYSSSEKVNRVYITGGTSTAKTGDVIQLTADNGTSKAAADFEWSSSYDTIATVDENGKVTFNENTLGDTNQQVSIYAMDKKTGVVGAYHFNMDIANESEELEFSEEDDENLLINGNAENGVNGWTDSKGTGEWVARPYEEWRGSYVYPYEGNGFFYASSQTNYESLYQDVDISDYQTGAVFTLGGWLANWDQTPHDQATLKLEFLDSKGKILDSGISQQRNPAWKYHSITAYKPAKAVKIRVSVIAEKFVGTDIDAYFDDITLSASEKKENKVYLSADKVTGKAGETIQLTANNGKTTKADSYSWSSSYDATATVDEKGLVTILQADTPFMIFAEDKSSGIIGSISFNSTVDNESPAPNKVSGFKVSKRAAKYVTLKWTKNAGASGYRIYQLNTKTKEYKLVKTIKKGSTSKVTVSKLSSGKSYQFKITAYKTYGGINYESEFSKVLTVKTK